MKRQRVQVYPKTSVCPQILPNELQTLQYATTDKDPASLIKVIQIDADTAYLRNASSFVSSDRCVTQCIEQGRLNEMEQVSRPLEQRWFTFP